MHLDLNSLLTEISFWKTAVKNKDAEIEMLQTQIKKTNETIETQEHSKATLLSEIAELNNAISLLQQSLLKLNEYEGEKKALVEENIKLKNCLADKEMLHQVQIVELKDSMEILNSSLKEDYEKKLSEVEFEASSKLQGFSIKLRDKENHILELEDKISKLYNENSQEILKIKLEYEEKVNRLKCKTAKNKGVCYSDDFKKTHIFRQKYIEKEREAREESSKLQKQIEDLQREITLLKNNSSLKNATKYNITNNGNEPNEELMSLEKDLHPAKRQKLTESCSDDDFDSLNVVSENFQKQSSNTLHHLKKKLFNLDMNYFNK